MSYYAWCTCYLLHCDDQTHDYEIRVAVWGGALNMIIAEPADCGLHAKNETRRSIIRLAPWSAAFNLAVFWLLPEGDSTCVILSLPRNESRCWKTFPFTCGEHIRSKATLIPRSRCMRVACIFHVTISHFDPKNPLFVQFLTLRWLMSYIYGAPILDVSRSHTTTQHSR